MSVIVFQHRASPLKSIRGVCLNLVIGILTVFAIPLVLCPALALLRAILIFRPYLLFFFFQAEDGIRDHCVTGVQTCALPILVAGHLNASAMFMGFPFRLRWPATIHRPAPLLNGSARQCTVPVRRSGALCAHGACVRPGSTGRFRRLPANPLPARVSP